MNNGDEGFRIRNNFILINNICYEVIYNKNYCSACPGKTHELKRFNKVVYQIS